MQYEKSRAYDAPIFRARIMGPNPAKLEEELLIGNRIPAGATVLDLGCGMGVTSVFLAREYGFTVYATDLWCKAEENQAFFDSLSIPRDRLIPVHADATEGLPFEPSFFDAIVTTDSYHYFGRDPAYLDEKLLPFLKSGGYVYIAIPGMKRDLHDALPEEMLLSWTPEDLSTMHDVGWWANIVTKCRGARLVSVQEMESMDEVWDDWLSCENEYAVGDRKAMGAGAGKYLNFVSIVLQKN